FLSMAADEARHYTQFRRAFEKHNLREHHRKLRRLRIVAARTLLVRDEDLPLAFDALNGHWRCAPPFALLKWRGYGPLLRPLLRRHFPIEAAARMLMKPVVGGSRLEHVTTAIVPRMLRHVFTHRSHVRNHRRCSTVSPARRAALPEPPAKLVGGTLQIRD